MSRFLNGMGVFSIWGVPEFWIIPIVELVGPGCFKKKPSKTTCFQRRFGVQDLQLLWFFLRTKQTWIWAEAPMLQAHSRKAWVWSDQSQLWQFSPPSQFIICFIGFIIPAIFETSSFSKGDLWKSFPPWSFQTWIGCFKWCDVLRFFFSVLGNSGWAGNYTWWRSVFARHSLKTTMFLVHVLQLK